MAGQLPALRRRIRSVRSTKKITKAQELVATSRIAKAQERVNASRPYAEAITGVLTALASHARIDHPLLLPRQRVRRAAVLVMTSDRGLCGAYNANAIRTTEDLIAHLRRDGIEPALYVMGRKGVAYYRFRNRPVADSWTGFSERPDYDHAKLVGGALIEAFLRGSADEDGAGADEGGDGPAGVDQIYVVNTRFRSLLTQQPVSWQLAPMKVEERRAEAALLPAYEFEPEPEELLKALITRYANARLYAAMLDSAASESASRRRAMKSATDNADEMIKNLTREMNSARQAAITQEISEIVGGANALASAGSEE